LQNAAWVVALYHNEASLLHRERGARLGLVDIGYHSLSAV
jgi:hypothetical protein